MAPKRLPPGIEACPNFYLDTGLGRVPGYSSEFIVGISPPSPLAVETLLWDQGGVRAAIPAPSNVFASSTEAGDTTSTVLVNALDENYDPVILSATLTGQAQVQLINVTGGSDTVVWVQSAVMQTAEPAGHVYVALTSALTAGVPDDLDAIQSKVVAGNNITRNGAYMVPNGKAAVFMAIRPSTDDTSKTSNLISDVTPFGQPRIRGNEYVVSENTPPLAIPLPFASTTVLGQDVAAFPERSLIEYVAVPTSNNTVTTIGFDLLIVDKEFIGTGQ